MNVFEIGAICGVVGGAVVGAILCKSHGVLAEAGGAVGGGIAGLFAGLLYGLVICVIGGITIGLWRTITGRDKESQRAGKDSHGDDKAA